MVASLHGSLTYFQLLCDFYYVKKASALSIFKQTRSVALPCFYLINLLLDSGFRVCFSLLWLHPPHQVAHVFRGCCFWRKQPTLLGDIMGVTRHRKFYIQSISTSAGCIDLSFPMEKGRCCFWDLENSLRPLGKWAGWEPVSCGEPGQARRQIPWFCIIPNVV